MIVRFRKQIHSCVASVSSDDIWLYRDIDLPFAPFIGLEVASEEDDWEAKIEEIFYRIPKNGKKKPTIFAYTESDKERYYGILKKEQDVRSVEEVAGDWTKYGWKIENH